MATLKEKLSYNQYCFVTSLLKQYQRKPKGRHWTGQDKSVALNIYLRSPSTYRALRRILNLPCIKTLRRSISGIANKPGFCPVLQESIRRVVTKMNNQDKICILSFDEMSIKSALQYNQHLDMVTGYENFGSGNSQCNRNKLATHALVFMIRGLYKHWKQAIGYFFSADSTPASVLKQLMFQAIDYSTEAGLKVVALVCDQTSINQRLFTDLQISDKKPFVQHNGFKIFTL